MKRRRDTGFSFIEVLVGMGLLTISVLVGAKVSQFISDDTVSKRIKSNMIGLTNQVSERIRYPDLCAISMGLPQAMTLNPSTQNPAVGGSLASVQEISITIPGLRAGAGMASDVLAAGEIIIPLGLQIQSLRLINPVDVSGPPPFDPAVSNRTIMAIAVMSAQRLNDSSHAVVFNERIIGTMLLDVTPANSIVGCRTDQIVSLKEVCEKFGCTYDVNAILPVKPCTCPLKPLTACTQWEVPTGIVGGQLNCKTWGGLCNPGFVMTGGSVDPAAATCVADPVWVPPLPSVSTNVEFAVTNSVMTEDNTANIQVLLPSVQSADVTLTFSVGGTATSGVDYNVPVTVIILAGNLVGLIPVSVLDDSPLADPGETVVLTLTGATGLTIGAQNTHTLTISDLVTGTDGLCGGASGNSYVDAAAANAAGLCAAGTATPAAVAGAGPWSWTCVGASGGVNMGCTATAIVGAPCPTVDGITLTEGQSYTFYSVPDALMVCGEDCGPEVRTCTGGVLSGTATNSTCNAIPLCGTCVCP